MRVLPIKAPASRFRYVPQSRQRRREALWALVCVAPALLGFILWHFGPIVASLIIAFMDWNMVGTPRWVGTGNFQQILSSDLLFRQSLKVTSYYALGSVPLRILFAFGLAVL